MIQMIAGEKGKGKTKILLDKVSADIKNVKGSLVYIDKNNKHMYELSNRIRLINTGDFFIENPKEFMGFLLGIISQDHDLEKVYLDSFLDISGSKKDDLVPFFTKLDKISTNFKTDFVISISLSKEQLPEALCDYVTVSL